MNKTFLKLGNKICFTCEWIKIKVDKLWGIFVDSCEWIEETLFDPIYNKYRSIRRALVNYKRWWKVIGKNYNFDSYYIYELLRHKLIIDEKFYRSDGAWGMGANKLADQMKLCIMLLNRIMDDNYHENAFYFHDKKWGELDMWSTPHKKKNGDISTELHELSFNRRKICNTNEYEQELKESRRLYKHADYMRQQDIDYLFKTMAKRIQGWWD